MPSAALLAMCPGWSGSSHSEQHRKHYQSRHTSPLELHDLSASDISRLTTILSNAPFPSLPPTAHTVQTYRTGTKSLIQALPDSLLSPVPRQAQIVSLLNRCGAECPDAAKLCKLHKRLNAQLTSDILGRIKDEIEGHLPRIMRLFPPRAPSFEFGNGAWPAWPTCNEKKEEDSSEEAARKVFLALQAIHGMYIPMSTFRSLYARYPPAGCVYQDDECAACMLARIGSDSEALAGLRALFLGRGWSDAKVRKSKRLLWVESWIMGFGAEAARGMLERSEKVGEMVQRKRKEKKREGMEEGEGRDGRSEMENKDEEGEYRAWAMPPHGHGTHTKATAQEVQSDIDSSSSTLVPDAPPTGLLKAAPRPCSSVYSDHHGEIQFIDPVANNRLHQRDQPHPLPPHKPVDSAQPRPRPSSSIYSCATYDFATDNRTSRTSQLPQHRLTTAPPLQPVHEDACHIPTTPALSVSTYTSESASDRWPSNAHLSSQTSVQNGIPDPAPDAHPPHNTEYADRPSTAVYSAYLSEHEDFLAYYMQPHSPTHSALNLQHPPPTVPTLSKPHPAASDARPNASKCFDTHAEEEDEGPGSRSGSKTRDTQWHRFMNQRWARWSDEEVDRGGS